MIPPVGPPNARIMIVGEAPGEQEMLRREPFVGASGTELNRMLHEAGIMRSECFITNVCREQPPGNDIDLWIPKTKKEQTKYSDSLRGRNVHPKVVSGYSLLQQEVSAVQPNIIIAFGNVSLWALTGKWGIKSWRGSLLSTDSTFASKSSTKVLPAYHPAYILRDWSARSITVQDLRRAKNGSLSGEMPRSKYVFITRPSYDTVISEISRLFRKVLDTQTVLSVDIETRAGHIACLGIGDSKEFAFCIPFMCTERQDGYWSIEEEAAIVAHLRRLLCHPNACVIGQNFIYDSQYIYRHWGFVPNFCRDTMLGHHSQFVGLPKGLDYLSSMYCEEHVYWKDEGKTWDASTGEDQLWSYNCKDCVITYEVDQRIQESIDKLGLRAQHDFQQEMFWPVLETMIRGVRIDPDRRAEFALELSDEIAKREQWFIDVLGHPLNPRSPAQMQRLFYEDLKQPPIYSRKKGSKGNLTLDDEALQKIGRRQPLLRGLVRVISEYRSLGVFLSTFVNAKLDRDGRLRCSYNIAGTETLRLSSSKNAFDSGLNLQNIPKGGERDDDVEPLELPNVRTLFVPDAGYTFFDADLDRADLQVVVWEADDAELRQMLLEGVDIHAENANLLGVTRPIAKAWVHATDYGAQARTMAITTGLSVHRCDQLRTRWFSAHPGIKTWQDRTEAMLKAKRYVENAFGYRRYYFDRVDGLLSEALAWIPQSTVALVINKIWLRIYHDYKDIQVLLQVHDSLAGQFPTHLSDWCIARIRDAGASVSVPYDTPLVIPLGVKTSQKSWGDCV